MDLRRVVVTGLGALTPIGNTAPEYWEGLATGVSGAAPITRFDASQFKTQFACEVKNLDVNQWMDRKEARKMDPYAQYAMIAADEAMRDSGLDPGAIDLTRAGVIWGSGIGGLKTFQDEVTDFALGDGTPKFNPFFIPKMIADIGAGCNSMNYGFQEPNFYTVYYYHPATNALTYAFNCIVVGNAHISIH